MRYSRTLALVVVVLVFASIISCVGPCFADTAQPVVAVDQSHSNLLRQYSPWNMSTLTNELESSGYAVKEIYGSITSEALSGCCALIITAPSLSYFNYELSAIQDFANAGGGVMICANYGVSSTQPSWVPICQNLAQKFGITLDNNSAYDSTHNMSGYPYWITFNSESIAQHPITTGVNTLQCFATTTMNTPDNASVLVSTDSDASPASRAAIIVKPYGQGRVVCCGSPLYLADPIDDLETDTGTYDMTGLFAADNRRFAYNAITWLAGSLGRPLLSASISTPGGIAYGQVDITGTVCDASLANYVLEYAPAQDQSQWTQIGDIYTSSVVNGLLGSWDTTALAEGDYVLRVRATNTLGGVMSVSIPVKVKSLQNLAGISDAKQWPDDTLVRLVDKEVIGGSNELPGRIFVEESNRTTGITILSDRIANRGSYVSVIGTLKNVGGILTINAVDVDVKQGPDDPIRPLYVANKNVGIPASGLSTAGILVKTCGKITSFDNDGFVITDGSLNAGLKIFTSYAGLGTLPFAEGDTVAVTGVSTAVDGVSGVVVRNSDDVQGTK